METYYIGLANTFHDPALAVINSAGEVLFAEATERYLQNKRAICCAADVKEHFRHIILEHCDPQARYVVAKPWSTSFARFMECMHLAGQTNHEKLPRTTREKSRMLVTKDVMLTQLWRQYAGFQVSGGHISDVLRCEFNNQNISFAHFPHHLAHAANACYTSPFEEAACIVVDGQGEFGAISYFDYKQGRLREIHRVKGEESLGILYSVCTDMCGFSSDQGEEWKLMGLAPYGKLDPELLGWFKELVQVKGLGIKYSSRAGVLEWFKKMESKERKKGAPALSVADVAWTTQHFYGELVTELLGNFHKLGLSDNLALGGGCGLNSSYNGQVVSQTPFKRLHVPSAPADDGNAIGAAYLAYYQEHPERKHKVATQSPYLGSSLSGKTLENLVRFGGFPHIRHLPGTIARETARILAEGKLVGWAQGRAEFGPRALGNRSILADPRPADMKDRINALVKFREEFRPFAPSILDEFGDEYFENYQVTPYMDRTLVFKPSVREKVPASVHINATGRLQTVRREWNPLYYDLIRAFYELTGVPMLLNTSFNIMGKPIIHSVEDALGVFCTTGLDALVLEDYLIEKKGS